jgi:hypothetical protein
MSYSASAPLCVETPAVRTGSRSRRTPVKWNVSVSYPLPGFRQKPGSEPKLAVRVSNCKLTELGKPVSLDIRESPWRTPAWRTTRGGSISIRVFRVLRFRSRISCLESGSCSCPDPARNHKCRAGFSGHDPRCELCCLLRNRSGVAEDILGH